MKYLKTKRLNEALEGWGKAGTIQRFGKDIVISDENGRSIQLTKNDVCDLVKVLQNRCKG